MGGANHFLFRWRWAIASIQGPQSPTTRHVLGTLGLHMDLNGQGAYPSEAMLAVETGLVEKSVRDHLKFAVQTGWISRKLWRDKGKDWAGYRYSATLPKAYVAPEPRSAPNHLAPERHADGAESDSTLVRNDVPTNSTENSTKNTTAESVSKVEGQKRIQDLMAKLKTGKF